jgi:hypothetical protein
MRHTGRMVQWLNENAGVIQALATIVLVGITYWYARLTKQVADATRRSQRASVAVDLTSDPGGARFVLIVENTGDRPALGVKIAVSSTDNAKLREELNKLEPIAKGLPYLAPGRRLIYGTRLYVNDVFPRDTKEEDVTSDPEDGWSAELQVTYRDSDHDFREPSSIDLSALAGLSFSTFDTDGTVIAKALRSLQNEVERNRQDSPLNVSRMFQKPCPYCRERLSVSALKCNRCGEWITDPPRWAPSQRGKGDQR